MPLSPLDREFVALGVAGCASVLDEAGVAHHADAALALGATADQVTEVLVTVSVIGMHTLTSGVPVVVGVLAARGDAAATGPLDAEREALRERLVGEDAYWRAFEERLPGFLDGMLRLSPEAFGAFFAYSALPWRSNTLSARLREELYVAIDATPTHVYEPGLRLHADNARRLGASEDELAEVLAIASRGDAATVARATRLVT